MAGTRRHFFPRKPVRDISRIVRRGQPAGELTIMPRPLDPSRDLLFGLLALQTGLGGASHYSGPQKVDHSGQVHLL